VQATSSTHSDAPISITKTSRDRLEMLSSRSDSILTPDVREFPGISPLQVTRDRTHLGARLGPARPPGFSRAIPYTKSSLRSS